MPNTITAYNTFVAGTKARATQVNTNFSNHRGTLLPIHESTQTAANLAYDLGSTEYYWTNIYARTLNLIGATTTSNLSIVRDAAVTAGAFDIKIGGTQVQRIAATSQIFEFSGTTVGSMNASGASFKKNIASGATVSSSFLVSTTTASEITSTSLSITVSGVSPVMLGLVGTPSQGMTAQLTVNTLGNFTLKWHWLRDGATTIGATNHELSVLAKPDIRTFSPSAFQAIDFNPSAGGHTYKLMMYMSDKGSGNNLFSFDDYQAFAMEL